MTQGLLKKTGTQDAGSIPSQVQMMKMLEVLFSYGCPPGSERHLQQPTCPQPICPSGFIAKQVPHLLDSYSSTRAKCQEFVATCRDHGGLPFSVDSPFLQHQCHCSGSTIQITRRPRSRETFCTALGGTTTCYILTAIWLAKFQCILTQVQRSSEPDMVFHRVSPFSPTNCLPAGPMSLEWPLAQPGGLVQPGHSLSQEDANSDRPGTVILVLHINDGDAMLFKPLEVFRDQSTRDTCVHIPTGGLRCISRGASWFCCLCSSQRSREHKHCQE